MFFRLALGNVRKSARDYTVYFVTIALGVAVFYAFNTISDQTQFLSQSVSDFLRFVGAGVRGTTFFLAFVLGFLMVYANNYLVRRRKRELGLYQVLGMTRGQVSGVLTLETLIASVGSLVVGLAAGILLSQVLVFVTAALLNDAVRNFRFQVSASAALITLACFAVIFLVMLLFNLRSLRKVNLSELMGAARENERVRVRSLPATIVMGVVGFGLMAWAYVRLTRDGLPISSPGQYRAFLVTSGLVFAGTIMFFYALSGILLRVGMARRSRYYRDINMFTIRQLASRVNTVAVSMGVISLVLFLAITISASGFALCASLNASLGIAAPYDASIKALYVQPDDRSEGFLGKQDLLAALEKKGVDLSKIARSTFQVTVYQPDEGNRATVTLSRLAKDAGVQLPTALQDTVSTGYEPILDIISESDYNAMRASAGKAPVDLHGDSYLFLANLGDAERLLRQVAKAGTPVEVFGTRLSPASADVDSSSTSTLSDAYIAMNNGTIVVPDSLVKDAVPSLACLNITYAGPADQEDKEFDRQVVKVEGEALVAGDKDGAHLLIINVATRNGVALETAGLSGIVAYLAIYIGFVLAVACAAILAIQQLSAASDAAPNYRLLSEIGVPRGMELRSLRSQVAWSFALPFVVAIAHSACALNQVLKVVRVFGKTQVIPYMGVSVGVFVAIYLVYFAITYAGARGIVTARTKAVRE